MSHEIDYEKRILRVLDYIQQHLDERLDLDALAEVACFSRWHWHRIYHGIMGETVATTVRRLRLHRAATQLADTEIPLNRIAQQAGFSSLSAFTRAFQASHQLTPAAFRARGLHSDFQLAITTQDSTMYKVSLMQQPTRQVAALAHEGSYMNIGTTFEKLYAIAGSSGLLQAASEGLGLYYDDPSVVPEADLRSFACISVPVDTEVQAPLQTMSVQGGEYAVLHYQGPYSSMEAAYQWLYGTWLPQSGREPAAAPCMELYLNNPRDTAAADLLTDICMPLV